MIIKIIKDIDPTIRCGAVGVVESVINLDGGPLFKARFGTVLRYIWAKSAEIIDE